MKFSIATAAAGLRRGHALMKMTVSALLLALSIMTGAHAAPRESWEEQSARARAQEQELRERYQEQERKKVQEATAAREEELRGLPACNDPMVIDALSRAINNSPAGNVLGMRVEGVEAADEVRTPAEMQGLMTFAQMLRDAERTGRVPTAKVKRLCSGSLYTNVGKRGATYTVEWMNPEKTKFWVEAINY